MARLETQQIVEHAYRLARQLDELVPLSEASDELSFSDRRTRTTFSIRKEKPRINRGKNLTYYLSAREPIKLITREVSINVPQDSRVQQIGAINFKLRQSILPINLSTNDTSAIQGAGDLILDIDQALHSRAI